MKGIANECEQNMEKITIESYWKLQGLGVDKIGTAGTDGRRHIKK
jgi:hypothetical protein